MQCAYSKISIRQTDFICYDSNQHFVPFIFKTYESSSLSQVMLYSYTEAYKFLMTFITVVYSRGSRSGLSLAWSWTFEQSPAPSIQQPCTHACTYDLDSADKIIPWTGPNKFLCIFGLWGFLVDSNCQSIYGVFYIYTLFYKQLDPVA